MNQLIQHLADEARFITVNGQTRYALAEEFEKRFAELIVQECINACGSDFGTELIKKHFGVGQ